MQKILAALMPVISILLFTPSIYAGSKHDDYTLTFIEYVNLNEELKDSVGKETSWGGRSYRELRNLVESFHENNYIPTLRKAKDYICSSEDAALLMEFYGVLISSTNSADEEPSWILGDIFLCKPEPVISTYSKLGYYEQVVIYNALDWGFQNMTYKKEDTISNFNYLTNKLASLKPKKSSIINLVTIPDGWNLLTEDEVNGKWGLNGFRYYYVVNEDFNGDGTTDEARLLARTDKSGFGLFVFLSNGNKYDVVLLTTIDDMKHLKSIGIDSVSPGTYATAFGKGYNGDYPKDEPKEITLKYHSINLFKSESANVFFHWIDSLKKFRRTQISD